MFAVCHTPDCENREIPIPIPADSVNVSCGVCGNPIDDRPDTPPELPEEMPAWEI